MPRWAAVELYEIRTVKTLNKPPITVIEKLMDIFIFYLSSGLFHLLFHHFHKICNMHESVSDCPKGVLKHDFSIRICLMIKERNILEISKVDSFVYNNLHIIKKS